MVANLQCNNMSQQGFAFHDHCMDNLRGVYATHFALTHMDIFIPISTHILLPLQVLCEAEMLGFYLPNDIYGVLM